MNAAAAQRSAVLERRALALATSGTWTREAARINTEIVRLDKNNVKAWTRLGRARQELGRLEEALAAFSKAIKLAPNNTIAGKRSQAIKAELAKRSDLRWVDDITEYQEAFDIGIAASRSRERDLAVAALRKALALRPDEAYAMVALAAAWRKAGELGEAERLYRSVLKQGTNPAAMVGLGAVLSDKGEFAKAQELYDRVLRTEPNNPYALNGAGSLHALCHRWDEAERCFRKAMLSGGRSKPPCAQLIRLWKDLSRAGSTEKAHRLGELMDQLGCGNSHA